MPSKQQSCVCTGECAPRGLHSSRACSVLSLLPPLPTSDDPTGSTQSTSPRCNGQKQCMNINKVKRFSLSSVLFAYSSPLRDAMSRGCRLRSAYEQCTIVVAIVCRLQKRTQLVSYLMNKGLSLKATGKDGARCGHFSNHRVIGDAPLSLCVHRMPNSSVSCPWFAIQ